MPFGTVGGRSDAGIRLGEQVSRRLRPAGGIWSNKDPPDRSSGHGPPVHRDHDAAYLGRAVTGQKEHGVGHILRTPLARQRLVTLDGGPQVVGGDAGWDVAGGDAVHPDAELAQIGGHDAGEVDDRRFGHAVDDRRPAPGEATDRRGIDDRAASVLGHVPAGPLGTDHHAEQVDGHHPIEVAEVVAAETAERTGDAGVVDHDVQPAEGVDGEVDQGLDVVGVATRRSGGRPPPHPVRRPVPLPPPWRRRPPPPWRPVRRTARRWRGRSHSAPPVTMATFPDSSVPMSDDSFPLATAHRAISPESSAPAEASESARQLNLARRPEGRRPTLLAPPSDQGPGP